MADPVLHVIAGPNGAGKTTFYARILAPATHLEFVSADVIAADRWPGTEVEHAYDAAELATVARAERIGACRSFATETVFSHESKVALLRDAEAAGYRVTLHIVLIPEELAVARVVDRVTHGGHHVPEDKIRAVRPPVGASPGRRRGGRRRTRIRQQPSRRTIQARRVVPRRTDRRHRAVAKLGSPGAPHRWAMTNREWVRRMRLC